MNLSFGRFRPILEEFPPEVQEAREELNNILRCICCAASGSDPSTLNVRAASYQSRAFSGEVVRLVLAQEVELPYGVDLATTKRFIMVPNLDIKAPVPPPYLLREDCPPDYAYTISQGAEQYLLQLAAATNKACN